MPVGLKGQVAWIAACALVLARLVSGFPYPITYLASMPGETLPSFGHATNSESQLAVIRLHTTHDNATLRDLCTGWAATADGQTGEIRWRTTDNVQWWRRFSKLHPDLLCANVVEPLADLNHWGVLNVLCVLLPQLAPVGIEMDVVIPQTNLCYTTSPNRYARRSSAFSANLPTGNRRLTLSIARVNCWNLCAGGVLDELGGAPPRCTPHGRRRLLLKESRQPRNISIGLHSQHVA